MQLTPDTNLYRGTGRDGRVTLDGGGTLQCAEPATTGPGSTSRYDRPRSHCTASRPLRAARNTWTGTITGRVVPWERVGGLQHRNADAQRLDRTNASDRASGGPQRRAVARLLGRCPRRRHVLSVSPDRLDAELPAAGR